MIDETSDNFFISIAQEIAMRSKDRSRKVGCVLVSQDNEIISTGFNRFPRGVDDTPEDRHQRPDKYLWTAHAEVVAVGLAVKNGLSLDGSVAYIPFYPCSTCAGLLIESGISRLVAYKPDFDAPKYGHDFRISEKILKEAGVVIEYVPGEPPKYVAYVQ
jgi:dCMP deaminase